MKYIKKFNEHLKEEVAINKNVTSHIDQMKKDISEDALKSIGYSILKDTGVKNSLHIVSDNNKFYALINKNDDGYDFCVRNARSNQYSTRDLDERSTKTLDEVIQFLGQEYNGKIKSV